MERVAALHGTPTEAWKHDTKATTDAEGFDECRLDPKDAKMGLPRQEQCQGPILVVHL